MTEIQTKEGDWKMSPHKRGPHKVTTGPRLLQGEMQGPVLNMNIWPKNKWQMPNNVPFLIKILMYFTNCTINH